MDKLIKNDWRREPGSPYETATILRRDVHPEGLDVARIRWWGSGRYAPDDGSGHIMSILRGSGTLCLAGVPDRALRVQAGLHAYLPPGSSAVFEAEAGSELLRVSGVSPQQARGTRPLIRDEMFLAACASGSQSLRWVLTPQYLSRRIFLHHDQTLLSKSGHPVSWYRTTMFDVAGLPANQDGESVFKMSYNSRTEFNVCYDVAGTARVRMARHPYAASGQLWGPWLPLDGDSTYHLNEAAGGPEEECRVDQTTGATVCQRNKHEVYIADGHVTLFCLFDPSPTGVERHRPGEYSDYEPLSRILGSELYESHRRELAKYDDMLDRLSMAKARGELDGLGESTAWELFKSGRQAQAAIEATLAKALSAEGRGREQILARWMRPAAE